MSTLVVFDTCTRPQYYADVHQLLALPAGTILRYDYQEKYFSPEALAYLRQLTESDCPIDVVLFYGQFEDYVKGSADPKDRMLDPATSVLIPTRFARLRNVAIEERVGGDGQSRSIVYFHMELAGFPNPDSPAIRPLLDTLAEKRELPFEKWVALAPEGADLAAFRQDDAKFWSKVVDRLATPPSQFHGDVFWRIDHLEKVGFTQKRTLRPRPRHTNRFGDLEFWSDYNLDPLSRYRLALSNFVPTVEGKDLPSGAAITIKADDTEQLTLPEAKQEFRRNASTQFKIGVKLVTDIAPRHIVLSVRTDLPGHATSYMPGSLADISVMTRISGYRVASALALALPGVAMVAGAAGLIKTDVPLALVAGVSGALLSFFGYVVFTGKIKLPGSKD
ncbi:hypothetical protein AQ619_07360 [Caulobacter henricii]|uniref:Uncharacterized protein n=2 Tax=Caulobacter henricii TaxID=69395 RepID=A0A0N7JHE7_9CAUL|nr:hypothetical protein AQ619_07360 [Caulobacter henricii]